jgi:subtilisin family serine protease
LFNPGRYPWDLTGHGTAVAGIIAASFLEGDVVGIASPWQCIKKPITIISCIDINQLYSIDLNQHFMVNNIIGLIQIGSDKGSNLSGGRYGLFLIYLKNTKDF